MAAGNDTNTVFLISSNDVDNSVVFTDSGIGPGCPHTVTPYGNVHHETDISKFYPTSMYFDGSGDYLDIAMGSESEIGTGVFTFDCWVYPLTFAAISGANRCFFSANDLSKFALMIRVDGSLSWYHNSTGTTTTNNMVLNQWNHIAVIRKIDLNIKIFINGVALNGNHKYDNNTSIPLITLGRSFDSYGWFSGYLAEARFSNVLRWEEDFTPPVVPYSIPVPYPEHRISNITLEVLQEGDISPNLDTFISNITLEVAQEGDISPNLDTFISNITLEVAQVGDIIDNDFPYIENSIDPFTILLIHSNNQESDTSFYDSAKYINSPHILTSTGAVYHTITNKKIDNSSIYFNGTGIITSPAIEEWTLTNIWSIDFWCYPTSISNCRLISTYNGVTNGWSIGFNNNKFNISGYGSNSFIGTKESLNTYSINHWYHIYVNSISGNTKLYINGIKELEFPNNNIIWETTNDLKIGELFTGYLDEIRISSIERWNTTFIPPNTSYGADPDSEIDSYTVLLLRSNNDNNDTNIIDMAYSSEDSPHAVTNTNVIHSTSKAKIYSSSLYFNGESYLTVPDSDDWYYNQYTSFTIDFWAYLLDSRNHQIINQRLQHPVTTNGSWQISIDTTNINDTLLIFAYTYNGSIWTTITIHTSPIILLNTWNHYAFVKKDGVLTLYINGVQQGIPQTVDLALYNSTEPIRIGTYSSGLDLTTNLYGYLDEFRISKGIARWISEFIPSIAPYPMEYSVGGNDNYCVLLLHSDNENLDINITDTAIGGTDSPHTLINSNVIHSTNNAKYNMSSIYFNGSGNINTISSIDWNLGLLSFTIDFWIYATSDINSIMTILNRGNINSINGSWNLSLNGTTDLYLEFSYRTDDIISIKSSNNVPLFLNTWHHIAVVYNIYTELIYFYIDGISMGSSEMLGVDISNIELLNIGSNLNTTEFLNNIYIDEFRISNGVCRWNTEFTPPIAPYDTYSIINYILPNYKKRIKYIISSVNLTEPLYNFPIPITLSPSCGKTNEDATQFFETLLIWENRKKIAVTTEDGITQCNTELEPRWDFSNKYAYLHSKIPYINNLDDTIIYIYFDNKASDNLEYIGDTGDISAQMVFNEYTGVWHMCQDPTSSVIKDSTPNEINGTPYGYTIADLTHGIFGDDLNNDGTEYVDLDTNVSDLNIASDNFTLEVIAKWTTGNPNSALFIAGNNGGEDYGITLGSTTIDKVGLVYKTYNGSNINWYKDADYPSDGLYHYIVGTYNQTTPKLFIDTIEKTGSNNGIYENATNRIADGNQNFIGVIGELRISPVIRNSNWIKATYDGLYDNFGILDSIEDLTTGISYKIVGIIKDGETPLSLTVALYRNSDKKLISVTTSSEVDGRFEFYNLDYIEEGYYCLVFDDVNNRIPVKCKLTPIEDI